jgi:glycosyltransferase involved in cell wall biosynthesis
MPIWENFGGARVSIVGYTIVHSMRNKVLFCGPTLAFPPIGGPELRVFNTLKAISQDRKVVLVAWNNLENLQSPESLRVIEDLGVELVTFEPPTFGNAIKSKRFFTGKLGTAVMVFYKFIIMEKYRRNKFIADQISEIAQTRKILKIWFTYANVSVPIIARIKAKAPKLVVVADTDSVWSRYILRSASFKPLLTRIGTYRSGFIKQLEERRLVNLADCTTAVSEVDQKYYQRISRNPHNIMLAYHVIDLKKYIKKLDRHLQENYSVLLSGTFGHKYSPMDVAAKWFIEEVWPLVFSKNPRATLRLVGRNSDKLWKSDQKIGLDVIGEVESIEPYLNDSRLSVVPLWFESGTRFKILEAAASGLPVVSTTLGAEGLDMKNSEEILIADDPKEFAISILKIFHSDLGISLGERAFQKVSSTYDLRMLELQVEKILNRY